MELVSLMLPNINTLVVLKFSILLAAFGIQAAIYFTSRWVSPVFLHVQKWHGVRRSYYPRSVQLLIGECHRVSRKRSILRPNKSVFGLFRLCLPHPGLATVMVMLKPQLFVKSGRNQTSAPQVQNVSFPVFPPNCKGLRGLCFLL